MNMCQTIPSTIFPMIAVDGVISLCIEVFSPFVLQDLVHDGTLCEAFQNANQPQTSEAFLVVCNTHNQIKRTKKTSVT